jgi:hypothetical protein
VKQLIAISESVANRALPFLLNLLGWGRCPHDDYTVPMRLPGGTGVTVSCLQCATRLRYDWDRMGVAYGQ